MKNGIDKRIIKTKKAIRTAFIDLVQQKDLNKITISELTINANITRSTFYMYYSDIGDVRAEIEDEMILSLDKLVSSKSIKDVLKNPYPFLRSLSDKIMKYDEMNKYLVCGNDTGRLFDKIKKYMVGTFMQIVPEERTIQRAYTLYITTFITSGVLDAYKEWYLNQSSLSLEDLCAQFSKIIIKLTEEVQEKKILDADIKRVY